MAFVVKIVAALKNGNRKGKIAKVKGYVKNILNHKKKKRNMDTMLQVFEEVYFAS